MCFQTSCYLNKDGDGKPVEEIKYQGVISFLLYLSASCPEKTFVVCMCACFQASLKEAHLTILKRIKRYLSGTQ